MTTEITPYAEESIEVQPIDNRDAAVTPFKPAHLTQPDDFAGIAAVPFPEKAQRVLAANQVAPDEWIDIRPDNGAIFMTHMQYRRILNEAFGFGGWAIRPVGTFQVHEDGRQVNVYGTFQLWVLGRFVWQTVGEGTYWKGNAATNYSDATEICMSNALVRLCKPMGLASNCWDKNFAENWKRKYATNQGGQWRRRDSVDLSTASAPAPARQQSTPAADPAPRPVATGGTHLVDSVSEQHGEKNGKPWTRFTIKFQGGLTISTFSASHAKIATEAGDHNKPVRIEIEQQGKFSNLKGIEIVDAPAADEDPLPF